MAVPLTWGGGNAIAWSGGDSSVPGSLAGSPFDPAFDHRPPPAPRDVVVSLADEFTLKVRWRDSGPFMNVQHPVVVHRWEIYVCPVELGGTPQDGPQWRRDVLDKGRSVARIASSNRGELLAMTITDDSFGDVYVQVVAFSNDNIRGVPSEPVSIYVASEVSGPLDDVRSPALDPEAFVDEDGNNWVDLNPSYFGPTTLGRFYGVSLHGVGYLGSTDLQEFGNVLTYTKNVPGMPRRFTVPRMASDKDVWEGGYAASGVIHATNGSATVTRVSGSLFVTTGAWDGKNIYEGTNLIGTISVVVTGGTLTLTAPFGGATNDYAVMLLNPMTFYFVSVDRKGRRRVDPLSAPSVSAPAGMFIL